DRAINALTAVIPRLGYTLNAVDNQNGLVTFETWMHLSSWASGHSMSAHVLPVPGAVQITISGTRKAHGAPLQFADFVIATKVFEQLNTILGQGQLVGGSLLRSASAGAVIFVFAGLGIFILIMLVWASNVSIRGVAITVWDILRDLYAAHPWVVALIIFSFIW